MPSHQSRTDRHREGLQCCRCPICEVQDEEQEDGQDSWGPHVSSCKWTSGTATASFSRCWIAVDLRLLCCRHWNEIFAFHPVSKQALAEGFSMDLQI